MTKSISEGAIGGGKQIVFLIAGKLTALSLTFLVPMVLSRVLDKAGYGIYAQFNSLTGFGVAFFTFAIPNNLYYFFSIKNQNDYKAILGNSLLILMFSAILACVLLCIPVIGIEIVGDSLYQYLPDICIYILLCIPLGCMEPFYVLMKDLKVSFWYPSLVMISRAAFIIVFVLFFRSVQSIFYGINVKNALVLLFSLGYMIIRLKQKTESGIWLSWTLFKEQWKYIGPSAITAILFAIAMRLDKIICIKYLTAASYATYSVAFFGVPGLQDIFTSIGQVYLVDMSTAYAKNEKSKVLQLLRTRSRIIFSFSLPILLGVCLYAEPIIRFIFSEKYLDSVIFFRIYLMTFCFAVLGAGLVIRASGRTYFTTISYSISSVICIPLTLYLVRNYGFWGGIISAVVAQALPRILDTGFDIHLLESSLKNYLPWWDFLRIAVVALLLLIPFGILNYFYPLNIFASGVLGCIYLGLVYLWEIRHDLFLTSRERVVELLQRYHLSWLKSLLA